MKFELHGSNIRFDLLACVWFFFFFFFFILEGVFKKCTSSETGALDQTVGISLYFRPVLSCGLVNVSVLDNDGNDY